MLKVADLPRTGITSLLSLVGIRRSSELHILVDGECHQRLSVEEVVDYVLGDHALESDMFSVYGRRIYLSVNVMENGDDDMASLSWAITEV